MKLERHLKSWFANTNNFVHYTLEEGPISTLEGIRNFRSPIIETQTPQERYGQVLNITEAVTISSSKRNLNLDGFQLNDHA